jgi:hypothetical protein
MRHIRNWLRTWLFREESLQLSVLLREVQNQREMAGAMKVAADQHFRDTDRRDAELQEQLADLVKMIEPNAARLRAPRPVPISDWDGVQLQNLKQFEENHG